MQSRSLLDELEIYVARLYVWEESESGHTNDQINFLFIAWVPAERTAYQSCFKVRVTPCASFKQQKTTNRARHAKSVISNI